MSALLVSRIDTTKLYPPFFWNLTEMLDEALSLKKSFWVISGFRTYLEQMKLWSQGRTVYGKICTNAAAGQSAHNFGIAVDLCLDSTPERSGLQPDWNPESYEPLRLLAPKHGLVWGGSWTFRDNPHVQWPGYVTGAMMQPLRTAYEAKGLPAVFAYLDKEGKRRSRHD